MNVLSLCSGYEGIGLGLALAGEDVELDAVADVDPHVATLLEQRLPDVPNLGDLWSVDWTTLERPDLLTAGYPCQPFSQSGLRRGEDDHRHLWPAVATAVRVLRPRRVLLENVAGHLSMGYGAVLGDLAALGYDTEWTCLRASDVGAPHQRLRVFLLALHTDRVGCEGPEPEPFGDVGGGHRLPADADRGRAGRAGRAVPAQAPRGGRTGLDVHAVEDARPDLPADTDSGRRQGGTQLDARASQRSRRVHVDGLGEAPADTERMARTPGGALEREPGEVDEPGTVERAERLRRVDWREYRPAIERWEHILGRDAPAPTVYANGGDRLNPSFVEWMMGLPEGWVCDLDLARSVKLKMLGNGVVPHQAAAAWLFLTARAQEMAA